MATARAELHLSLRDKLKSGLDSAKQKVNKDVGTMQAKLNAFRATHSRVIHEVSSQVPQIGAAFGLLTNPVGAVVTGVVAVGSAIGYAAKKAIDWRNAMAEINVTAELTQDQLKKLSDRLMEVGARNASPLEEVPKAFSRIISAGLSVKQSLEALEPTIRAAKAGFADIETVAGAGIATMMASGENINKVYDILFETVKEGNAEFADIARYLPKIIPIAKKVGFALDETAGAFASLTGKLSVEQSTVALQGIMRALGKKQVVTKLKAIGVEVFDVKTGKIKPVLNIIKELKGKMDGLTDSDRMKKFASLGLDDMATLGFGTLIQDVQGLEKATYATVNSAGAMEKAYADSLTPMESWKMVWNQLNVYIIKFGELFLPMISKAGQKVLDFIRYWKKLYKESVVFRDSLSFLVGVFKILFRIQVLGWKFVLNNMHKVVQVFTWWYGLIGRAIRKVTGFQGSWTSLYLKIKPMFIWFKEMLAALSEIMDDVFNFRFAAAKDKIKKFAFPNLDEITAKVLLDATPQSDTDLIGAGEDAPQASGLIDPSAPITDDGMTIKGGGQTKNITVNFDSFIKNLSPQHQSLQNMSKDELERYFKELFMRMIRSLETMA